MWRSAHHIVGMPTSSSFGKPLLCAHSPLFEHTLLHMCTQNTLCGTKVCDWDCPHLVILWYALVNRHVTLWTLTEKTKCSSCSHVVNVHHPLTLLNAQCVIHIRLLPQKWPAHLLPAGAPPAGSSGSGAALRVQERHPGPVPQRKPRSPTEVKMMLPHIQEHQGRYWNIYRDAGLMVWLLQLLSQVTQDSKHKCDYSAWRQRAHENPDPLAGPPSWCKCIAARRHALNVKLTTLQTFTSFCFLLEFQPQCPPAATSPPISGYEIHTFPYLTFIHWFWFSFCPRPFESEGRLSGQIGMILRATCQFQVRWAGLLEVGTGSSWEAASPETRPRSSPAHPTSSTTELMYFCCFYYCWHWHCHFLSLYHTCKEFTEQQGV